MKTRHRTDQKSLEEGGTGDAGPRAAGGGADTCAAPPCAASPPARGLRGAASEDAGHEWPLAREGSPGEAEKTPVRVRCARPQDPGLRDAAPPAPRPGQATPSAPPHPRRAPAGPGRTVPGAGGALRPRPGPAAGRGVPGTRGGCSPSSPRLGSGRRGLRAAASDGRAQPLQWHRAGRGARVTAAGAPKPGPPRPARARRHRPRFPRIARLALKQNKEITQAAPGLEAAAVDPALPATQGHGSRRLSRGKNHSPAFHAR